MSYKFYEKTWPELAEYVEKQALIILPVGELEEHSLYLPVDTDARIATFIAEQIAEEIGDEFPVLVMPTVWSGYTPSAVCKWPGGMSLPPTTFIDMMYGICASIANMGFKKLFMLDCHGQHAPMLNVVTKMIADKYGYYYTTATPVPFMREEFNAVRKSDRGGTSHAGEMEASMILHISPELVRTDKFTDVDKQTKKYSVIYGMAIVYSNGLFTNAMSATTIHNDTEMLKYQQELCNFANYLQKNNIYLPKCAGDGTPGRE